MRCAQPPINDSLQFEITPKHFIHWRGAIATGLSTAVIGGVALAASGQTEGVQRKMAIGRDDTNCLINSGLQADKHEVHTALPGQSTELDSTFQEQIAVLLHD